VSLKRGSSLSHAARLEGKLSWGGSLTYGEVESYIEFSKLLRDVVLRNPKSNLPRDGTATFADLGCGNGRALAAAALLPLFLDENRYGATNNSEDSTGPKSSYGQDCKDPNADSRAVEDREEGTFFARCYGVEVLPALAEAATAAGAALERLGHEAPKTSVRRAAASAAKIEAQCGSIEATAELGWGPCDFVYAASTCFTDELIEGIVLLAAKHLKPGATLVTLRMPRPDSDATAAITQEFEPVFKGHHSFAIGPYNMSWGGTVAHCLVKRKSGASNNAALAASSLTDPPPFHASPGYAHIRDYTKQWATDSTTIAAPSTPADKPLPVPPCASTTPPAPPPTLPSARGAAPQRQSAPFLPSQTRQKYEHQGKNGRTQGDASEGKAKGRATGIDELIWPPDHDVKLGNAQGLETALVTLKLGEGDVPQGGFGEIQVEVHGSELRVSLPGRQPFVAALPFRVDPERTKARFSKKKASLSISLQQAPEAP